MAHKTRPATPDANEQGIRSVHRLTVCAREKRCVLVENLSSALKTLLRLFKVKSRHAL